MQAKKTEGEYLLLEPAVNEMSEQFIINLETNSDNSSGDTESTRDVEISGADPLDI
jgi:hypothetical protein